MITDSPHLYRQTALAQSVPPEFLDLLIRAAYETERHGLQAVLTLKHLAHQTGADHSYLRNVIGRDTDPYDEFLLQGKRLISSPHPAIRAVQKWILANILGRVACHPASFAYERNKSIAQCARRHLGAKWLVKLDIHNFFPSIDEREVFRIFTELGYRQLISFEMARLCTRPGIGALHKIPTDRPPSRSDYTTIRKYRTTAGVGYLPQGSPTSGALANLAMRLIDERITEAISGTSIIYTRYADDITFSTAEKFSRQDAVDLIRMTDRILRLKGFLRHERKTKVVPPGARKIVLGILVDSDHIKIPIDTRNRLVNDIRGAEKFGLLAHAHHRNFSSALGFGEHISGMLSYCHDVDPGWTEPLWKRWSIVLRNHNIPLTSTRHTDKN
jgi:RNA-directed DNA polymerase